MFLVLVVQFKLEQLKKDFNALNKEIGKLKKVFCDGICTYLCCRFKGQ